MNPEQFVCPACLRRGHVLVRQTKTGNWWWRCQACVSNGFVNTPWGWHGWKWAERLEALYGTELCGKVAEEGGSVIERMLRERPIITASPGAPVKEPSHAA